MPLDLKQAMRNRAWQPPTADQEALQDPLFSPSDVGNAAKMGAAGLKGALAGGALLGSIHPLNVPRTGVSLHDTLSSAAKNQWLERNMAINEGHPGIYGRYTATRRANAEGRHLPWNKSTSVNEDALLKDMKTEMSGDAPFTRNDAAMTQLNMAINKDPMNPIEAIKGIGPSSKSWSTHSYAPYAPQQLGAMVQQYDLTYPVGLRRLMRPEKVDELLDWSKKQMGQ